MLTKTAVSEFGLLIMLKKKKRSTINAISPYVCVQLRSLIIAV